MSYTTLFSAFSSFSSDERFKAAQEMDQQEQLKFNRLRDRVWKLSPWLQEIVDATRTQILSQEKGYACLHVRRSDFKQYCQHLGEKYQSMSPKDREKSWLRYFDRSNCYPTLGEIESYILEKWNRKGWLRTSTGGGNDSSNPLTVNNTKLLGMKSIYIASDSPEEVLGLESALPNGFSFFTQNVVYRAMSRTSNFSFTDPATGIHKLPQINDTFNLRISDLLPFIEQELCMKADFFMGNYYSTFSRRIVKARDGLGYETSSSVFFGLNK